MNVREKWWLVFDIVLPLIGLCAYVFIYRANNAPADLIGFVIIGGAMSAYWMNVLWSMGNQLFWEKETGNLALYIMAPNSMMAMLLGMALGGMFTTTVRAVSILAIGSLLFDVQFAVESVPLLVGGVRAGARRALRHGDDVRVDVPDARPRGVASREPGAGAGVPAVGDVFPDSQLQLLGCRGRVDHSADAGARRDSAVVVRVRRGARLSRRANRGGRAGVSCASLFLIAARLLLQRLERMAIAEGRLTEARA